MPPSYRPVPITGSISRRPPLLSSVGVCLDHGARNGIAGKPIAQSIVPIVMLGWEPLIAPSPVAAEVQPCPLQSDLRLLVPLTKHHDAIPLVRPAHVSITLGPH